MNVNEKIVELVQLVEKHKADLNVIWKKKYIKNILCLSLHLTNKHGGEYSIYNCPLYKLDEFNFDAVRLVVLYFIYHHNGKTLEEAKKVFDKIEVIVEELRSRSS